MGKKERSSNFELMRVISMLAILAFHYQIHIDADTMMYQAFSNNQLIAIVLGSWGTLGTNLFFILSFYFWITSAKYKSGGGGELTSETDAAGHKDLVFWSYPISAGCIQRLY